MLVFLLTACSKDVPWTDWAHLASERRAASCFGCFRPRKALGVCDDPGRARTDSVRIQASFECVCPSLAGKRNLGFHPAATATSPARRVQPCAQEPHLTCDSDLVAWRISDPPASSVAGEQHTLASHASAWLVLALVIALDALHLAAGYSHDAHLGQHGLRIVWTPHSKPPVCAGRAPRRHCPCGRCARLWTPCLARPRAHP